MSTKNLYQKLLEVRKQVQYIKKSADGYKFKYASEGDILSAIRPMMDEQGVWLEMEMLSMKEVECQSIVQGKVVTSQGLRVEFEFKWVNCEKPEEVIVKHMAVQDAETCIKTIGSLYTYANRYFLYKFFSVATDKDDPDAVENKQKKIVSAYEEPKVEERITEEEALNLEALLLDLDDDQFCKGLKQYLAKKLELKIAFSDWRALPRERYSECFGWIKTKLKDKEAAQA